MNISLRNAGIILLAIAFISFIAFSGIRTATAYTPGNLPAMIATTSPAAVTTAASTLFATSSPNGAICADRIITTGGSDIRLTFSDRTGQSPTTSFGHLQLASTTVVYDSTQYGCGLVKAYSFASQTLTISEAR